MKVRTRLFLVFLGITGCGLLLLWAWVDRTALPVYLASLEDDLVETAAVLTAFLEEESTSGDLDLEALGALVDASVSRRLKAEIYGRRKEFADFRVTVTNHNGRVIFDSLDGMTVGDDFSKWNDVARTLQGQYGARATWVDWKNERILALYVALPVVVNGRLAGALTVSKPTSVAQSFWPRARKQILWVVVLVGLLVLAGGFALTQWVTRPIRRLTHYADAVARGDRVGSPNLGRSDMGQLAKSFETMRQALDGKKYVEEYVQTLTHEIKSPLSAIRGAAELIDDKMPADKRTAFLGHILTETSRIQQLIDRLLELSALESKTALGNVVSVDLGDLARELVAEAKPAIRSKDLEIRFDDSRAIVVQGDPFLLRLAISNLLQNALAFVPEKGWIAISFGRRSIRLTDSGPGIPEYAERRVFHRFYSLPRAESGRKSTGLGLTIVRQIAELHQGGVQLRNAKGAGAQATLWFPFDSVQPKKSAE